ncbi:hypothetical protein ACFYT3_31665 [Nocardia amikacinitolerans]|uniref:hypothetical protein n=1 Tax=Nocardia amikacinitolerans TaxID=756689 RepID=UPI0036B03F79
MTDNRTHDRAVDTQTNQGWEWLDITEPTVLQAVPTGHAEHPTPGSANEWQWIAHPPAVHTLAATPWRARLPRRGWAALAAGLAVAAALVVAGIVSIAGRDYTPAAIPTVTAHPPAQATTAAVSGACAGLSGQTVTAGAGDTHSLAGVIAAFEHAYYVQRNPEVAMGLLAIETGVVPEALAAGISSIPAGSTHCVAITPIADGAAEVHLVELHPDGARIDYLQLINLRRNPDGATVITNIQKRG